MANILIVEDEKNMQSIIAEYMQRGGHTCFTADDGVDRKYSAHRHIPPHRPAGGSFRYSSCSTHG